MMLNTKHLQKLIILLGVIQLALLCYPMIENQFILWWGTPVRFQVTLQDPYEVFRGRFIQVQMDTGVLAGAAQSEFEIQDSVYVTLGKGSDGSTVFNTIQREKPDQTPFLKTKVTGISASSYNNRTRFSLPPSHDPSKRKPGSTVFVDFPFSRIYHPKVKAIFVDADIRNGWITGPKPYVIVKMLNGRGVVDDLYLYGEIDRHSAYYPSKIWLNNLTKKSK